jgi:hypothetical protein
MSTHRLTNDTSIRIHPLYRGRFKTQSGLDERALTNNAGADLVSPHPCASPLPQILAPSNVLNLKPQNPYLYGLAYTSDPYPCALRRTVSPDSQRPQPYDFSNPPILTAAKLDPVLG